ncbi:unnamed protein product, partial [Allacma fusca]
MCAALVSPTDSGMGSPSSNHPHPVSAFGVGVVGLRSNPNLGNIPPPMPPNGTNLPDLTRNDPPQDVLLALLSRNRALE